MGNHKFRLSDMMPNAWFYKLRDMSRTRNHSTSHPVKKKIPSPSSAAASHKPYYSQPYYHHTTETTRSAADKFYNSPTNPKLLDTHFPDPPRKSSKRSRTTKISRKTIYKPSPRLVTCSVSASDWSTNNLEPARPRDCVLSSTESSFSSPDQSEFESNTIDGPDPFDGLSSSCSCRVTCSTTDIIIDVNGKSSFSRKVDHKLDGFDSIPRLELPPILTKPVKFKEPAANPRRGSSSEFEDHQSSFSKKDSTKTTTTSTPSIRKSGSNSSTGVRIRANSPRIACKKVQGRRSVSSVKGSKSQRRSFSAESFAIVKSSFDPQKDFKDSMVEMIVENNIRASKDLEELLACYLSLNSDEYHELIVKAFEQIWFDMADLRM